MTPQEQRIAIAQACPEIVEWHDGKPYWRGSWSSVGEGNEHFAEFDPLNDLNAMHEAEKVLRPAGGYGDWARWDSYVRTLGEQFTGTDDVAHATAAEKAKAFLRTLDLWTS